MPAEPLEPVDPRLIATLASGAPFDPHDRDAGGVEHIQTHISHVFLTQRHVYKVRKSVRFEFVDFSSRRERNADCLREIELNRRLAPDVYLGIATLRVRDGDVRIGPVTERLDPGADGCEAPEHCVVMRRLPSGRDALGLLERGALATWHLDAVAERIARLHREHPLRHAYTTAEWRHRVEHPVVENLRIIDPEQLIAPERCHLEHALERCRVFLAKHWDRFEARRARAVEGHGDLHLEHIWLETDTTPPLIVDCVEFGDLFRHIDAASDVAFLAMDLIHRGRADLSAHFLSMYAARTDDFDLYSVVDYFLSYRAGVRAKVGWLKSEDPHLGDSEREQAARSARAYLALAATALEPRSLGATVVVTGPVGTGKSHAAATVASHVQGVVIASDRVRKRLAGLDPLDRSGTRADTSIYTRELTERTYQGLYDRATPVVRSGRSVILDATFATVEQRAGVLAWARSLGVTPLLLEMQCAPEVTRTRLIERTRRGDDPSDAGPALQEESARTYQPPDEWAAADRFRARSDAEDLAAELAPLLRRLTRS